MTILIQFAKPFELGRVKTRLAATMGEPAALEIHKQLSSSVNKQLRTWISERKDSTKLWLSTPSNELDVSELDTQFRCAGLVFDALVGQHGKGLGERMLNAARIALQDSQAVIIVGSDFPVLDKAYLDQAIEALEINDAVLGPSDDGGYGLIGFSNTESLSFNNVKWGTDQAFLQSLKCLDQVSLSYSLLPARYDVDLESDYQRWRNSRWYSEL